MSEFYGTEDDYDVPPDKFPTKQLQAYINSMFWDIARQVLNETDTSPTENNTPETENNTPENTT